MAAPMVRTRHPGIYKRGSRYVVIYRAGGRQRKESAGTLTEARKLRAARQADVARGEFHEATRLTFQKYASEWVERYQGRGHGFRESTRDDYRRLLEVYAFPYFDERLRRRTLSQITPRDVANFVGWLCDERGQAKHHQELAQREAEAARQRGERLPRRRKWPEARRLSDSTVRNALNPVRACLATAVGEGLIRHNPTLRVPLPHRPVVDDLDGDEVRAFTREQLDTVLRVVPPRHQLFFRLMAATGIRISEAIALQWHHVSLDGAAAHVKVRRGIVRGRVQPPKSRHGRRDIPLDHRLVSDLRRHRVKTEWPGERDFVFPSMRGTALIPRNMGRRVLAPAAEEAGAAWAGFHTFRHTCASMLFERGANAKQVQRWLGHHSAAFTLATYVHLLSDHLDAPLDLTFELTGESSTPRSPGPAPSVAGAGHGPLDRVDPSPLLTSPP